MSTDDTAETERRGVAYDGARDTVLRLRAELEGLLLNLDPEDDIDPQRVKGLIQVAVQCLTSNIVREAYLTAPSDALGRQPINSSFLSSIQLSANGVSRALTSMENLNLVNYHLDTISSTFKSALARNGRTQHRFIFPKKQAELDQALQAAQSQIAEIENNVRARRSVHRIEQAATIAEASADAASRAAGLTADVVVSSHFQSMAKKELASANRYRLLTMGAMGLGGFIATFYLLGPAMGLSGLEIGTGDYVHLLQRVLVVGAVFAFAAYTGRQAHNHRTLANWADSLSVQLQTFDAYCDAIGDQSAKDALRTAFAGRAFGAQPGLKGDSSPDNGDALIQKAAEVLSKIVPGDK